MATRARSTVGTPGKAELTATAERVPYCGIRFGYAGLRQWSGPDDPAFASRASETFTIRFDP